MSTFPIAPRHLHQIRRQLALLIARIEHDCSTINDPTLRRRLEGTSSFAHDLLDKVSLAEQAVAGKGDITAVLTRLDERIRVSQARIDALHDELERVELHKHPGAPAVPNRFGSTMGDGLRDSFSSMGG